MSSREELVELRADLEDQRAAKRTAAEAADRFRDVLSDALGHPDENPGDDVLIAELRAHFGRTGPEPTRWRNFLTGVRAQVDQLNEERQRGEARTDVDAILRALRGEASE